jgi:hypothetical protein
MSEDFVLVAGLMPGCGQVRDAARANSRDDHKYHGSCPLGSVRFTGLFIVYAYASIDWLDVGVMPQLSRCRKVPVEGT